jgi:hypothetical protein
MQSRPNKKMGQAPHRMRAPLSNGNMGPTHGTGLSKPRTMGYAAAVDAGRDEVLS